MNADPTREPSDAPDPGSPPAGDPGSPPPEGGWSPPPGGSAPPLVAPPLQRRSDRRVVAGVCSGVAYRLGVDPTLVRVVVVALSFLGGAGILLYALGWLLMPEDTTGRSLADRVLRGDGTSPQTVLLAVGLGLVVVLITVGVLRGSWFGLTLVALLVVAGVVLLSRRSAGPPAAPPAPAPPGRQPAAPSFAAGPTPSGYGPSPAYATPTTGYPPLGYDDYAAGYPYAPEQDLPPTPEPARPRSYLGALTFFAAVLAVGVLGLVDALGASVPLSAYPAAALAVTGLGLVVGAWFGRSRGLVALGVGLSVVLIPVATLERADISGLDEAFVQDTIEPTSARAIDGRTFEHGVGDITYDLSEIDFTDRSTDLSIQMGSGNLLVTVPDEVAVELDASVGMGQVDAFGSASSGIGVSRTQDYPGEADGGTLRLDIEMGFGNVEVDRADA